MKYLPILLLFFACSEDEQKPNKDVLRFSLNALQKERDSLRRVMSNEMGRSFEFEATQSSVSLVTDTSYNNLQKTIKQLDSEIKAVDRRIEQTEEELYRPD
jgi:flagellar capping protein FliD